MTIVYVLHSTDTCNGATKAFFSMLKGIVVHENIRPIVAVPDRKGIYKELKSMGILVNVTPMRMNVYPDSTGIKNKLLFYPRLFFHQVVNAYAVYRLTKAIHKLDIDLIHTNVSVIDIGFRVASKLGIPHIYHIRELADKMGCRFVPSEQKWRECLNLPRSYAICITRAVSRHYQLEDDASATVIYDGVCKAEENVFDTPKQRFFLYAGRIEALKGVHILLKAYRQYLEKNGAEALPLRIAGAVTDCAYENEFRQLIEETGMIDHVSFLGQQDDVAQLMRQATATIVPSLTEGFGLCMTEAMFNRSLVIAHNVDGLKEQFDNGLRICDHEIGLRYDTEDDLCQHLTDVTQNGIDNYAPIVSAAAKTVQQLYTTEQNANNVYNFYRRIINNQ